MWDSTPEADREIAPALGPYRDDSKAPRPITFPCGVLESRAEPRARIRLAMARRVE